MNGRQLQAMVEQDRRQLLAADMFGQCLCKTWLPLLLE